MYKIFYFIVLALLPWTVEAKLPPLTPQTVTEKINEIMKAHASYKVLTPELVKRALQNNLEELDPNKTYFIESDIGEWVNPSDAMVEKVLNDYKNNRFDTFFQMHDAMIRAIQRRRILEKQVNMDALPTHVSIKEFKDMKWAKNQTELLERLTKIKALQTEGANKLSGDLKEKAMQRVAKRQSKYEEEILDPDPLQRERKVLVNVLKSTASALDTHTIYFTPEEATQFMISMQQRLFGIGAQLRDDLNGFSVVKVIEGGPAAAGKELKVKDRIIAVNGEPVVGMDIIEAVGLIRGEENTPVTLTVVRDVKEGETTVEKKLDIVLRRGQVVFKDARFSASYEPFGDGVIGYLRLYSFYQDSESSSTEDLEREIKKLEKEHNLKGIVLDLRYNTGGLLTQAVDVAGLFITKGTVVSVKDNTGSVQHLRAITGEAVWGGPLVILINRASASASEIVAQTLQDYGRALLVGDDHSYGKGSFQTFTLATNDNAVVNPEGEYKVTRGRYYTVSGKTPQLTGVNSDIVIPGALSFLDIGEQYAKYPLANDKIKPNFDDDLADIPFTQRNKIRMLYKFDLQQKMTTYDPYLSLLKSNSTYRIEHNKGYQALLNESKKESDEIVVDADQEEYEEPQAQNDVQLNEAMNVMKDLLILMHQEHGELKKAA